MSTVDAAGSETAEPFGESDFVVVANRLPVDRDASDPDREWRTSPGGLVTAVAPVVAAAAPAFPIIPVLCHLHPPRAVSVDREIHLCPNPPRPAAVPAPDPSGVTDAAPGGSGQRRVPSGFTSTHSPRSAEM